MLRINVFFSIIFLITVFSVNFFLFTEMINLFRFFVKDFLLNILFFTVLTVKNNTFSENKAM
ncbi:hypothetical protein DW091_14845 [Eubacterium sp. AM05-23]|nr:hypothetical protein DW091_14845 [Eubacterium sp. AM05-23]